MPVVFLARKFGRHGCVERFSGRFNETIMVRPVDILKAGWNGVRACSDFRCSVFDCFGLIMVTVYRTEIEKPVFR